MLVIDGAGTRPSPMSRRCNDAIVLVTDDS